MSHLFYVKLIEKEDFILLEQLAEEKNVEIMGNNEFMPLWYTLSCSKDSKGDALDMANLFYESKLFEASVPDLMSDDEPACTNDYLFGDQWGLSNTGQYEGISGIDINFCQARQITTGNQDIIIAIVDNGMETNHPDLNNIYPISYDAHTSTSPSVVRGPHGMPCAGIVGATANNYAGVAGIAPDCPLMDISISLAAEPDARQKRADGINFACANGASVISNSWGSTVEYQIIDDAIENALEYGRNGLGCVVAFSTGNDNNPYVEYPANSHEGIIAVGASNMCGERANSNSSCFRSFGSDYGPELDIMAPGVVIPTTDRQGSAGFNTSSGTTGDYYYFSGTSAACPHVSAIAGLLLSEHPNITREEVSLIIESTAQKTGGYYYQTTSGRPNGTWNIEMGYGFIDAYAVLQADVCETTHIINTTYTSNATLENCYVVLKNVKVDNNAKLTIETEKGIKIIGEFEVKAGSEFEIN